jgi:hypothetical protein
MLRRKSGLYPPPQNLRIAFDTRPRNRARLSGVEASML